MLFFETLAVAFGMYSALPMPRIEWNERNMRYCMCAFPLIGAVIGAAFLLWSRICSALDVNQMLFAAVSTLLPLGITGGIHLDGFCDTVDALSAHAPKEKSLMILKDPHIGAFGVMGCLSLLLLSFGFWCQVEVTPAAGGVLGLGFVFSRVLSGLSVVSFPAAKRSGTLAAFSQNAQRLRARGILIAAAGGCTLALPYWGGAAGIAAAAAAWAAFIGYYRISKARFGGITGDLAGWFLQICEAAVLGAVVAVQLLIR